MLPESRPKQSPSRGVKTPRRKRRQAQQARPLRERVTTRLAARREALTSGLARRPRLLGPLARPPRGPVLHTHLSPPGCRPPWLPSGFRRRHRRRDASRAGAAAAAAGARVRPSVRPAGRALRPVLLHSAPTRTLAPVLWFSSRLALWPRTARASVFLLGFGHRRDKGEERGKTDGDGGRR